MTDNINNNETKEKVKVQYGGPITEFYDIPDSEMKIALSTVEESSVVFDEDAFGVDATPVPGYESSYKYIPFGRDNMLPFYLLGAVETDEIMSQNLFFNILTGYGAGLRYVDINTGKTARKIGVYDHSLGGMREVDINRFFISNSLKEFSLEQMTDMKHLFFTVAVVILNKEGAQIVQVRHKDSQYCRFEQCDRKGRINHVFYANWRKTQPLQKKDIEVIQLLDEKNPLGHLEVLMGRAPGEDGEVRMRTTNRKFGIVMRFPTPGMQYYPKPYYVSIFRGDWYDIKRLIGRGKKSKIRNHAGVKYHVEIDKDYWTDICTEEGIIDPQAQKMRINKEKEQIRDFVTGIENSGKMWISGFYTSPDGKEQHMVKINVIDSSKEGGDWSDDISEASNMLCYGCNIHPNLVGANPGKSQTNNSGSDKRELFTLKQSLETATKDMLEKVHNVVIYFNGWEDSVSVEVPIIMLTTLDQHTDAKTKNPQGEEREIK